MTTIEFGGGPSLEARRAFTNLKEGSQVPKYTGHIHQLRYRHGHTYGDETHRLAKDFPQLTRSNTDINIVKIDQSDPYETREFPDGMLPGYTGYIPQRKYQLGNRYRVETDACLTGTKATYENARSQAKRLRNVISAYPKTQSVNSDTVIKHFLDFHRAYHPTQVSQQSDHRPFLEPPIPGYRGYIPRLAPTDLNLGLRYHEAAKKGLSRFVSESVHSTSNYPTTTGPVTESSVTTNNVLPPRPQTTLEHNRVYPQSGMIPKYTGYLPQRKYRVGQTYGDTSRELPVCSHSFGNYGDYVRAKTSLGVRTSDVY